MVLAQTEHFAVNQDNVNLLLSFTRTFDQGRKTEVTNFNIHVRVKEKITKLEVAVDDLVVVHEATRANDLHHEESRFWFCKSPPLTKHIHHRLETMTCYQLCVYTTSVATHAAVAELQSHIDIIRVFKAFIEENDVWMLERLVDFDFCIELVIHVSRLKVFERTAGVL